MLEWFSAAVASANATKDIAASLLTLRDEEVIRSRVFDLTGSLMDIQQQMMTAQLEQMELIKRISELEADLVKAKSQTDTRERYERHKFESGNFAYSLKPEHAKDVPEHYLCSNCFEKGETVTLQRSGGIGWTGLKCPRCNGQVPLVSTARYKKTSSYQLGG
ncbi:hypothetical protein IMW75_25105 [Pseudomonas gregormendelii]|uniref:Uncharacterized protein n=1 Tax=Pseudomonas gregormendelii TaxID=1628277 RepID=A0ABS3ANL4_9PSED|nr:hypothetical protein [Pseudomonas gregormendelii]MBN3968535.1 hypothetical protein [Pseudomonas gregormendelii]